MTRRKTTRGRHSAPNMHPAVTRLARPAHGRKSVWQGAGVAVVAGAVLFTLPSSGPFAGHEPGQSPTASTQEPNTPLVSDPPPLPPEGPSVTALDDPRFVRDRAVFPSAGLHPDVLAGITCGDPVTKLTDLPASDGIDLNIESVTAHETLAQLINMGGTTIGPDYQALPPVLVWAQDGQLVDAGSWPADIGHPFTREDGTPVEQLHPFEEFTATIRGGVEDDWGWSCGTAVTDTDEQTRFPDARPGGVYDVYAVAAHTNGDGQLAFTVSSPVTVAVPDAPALMNPAFNTGGPIMADENEPPVVCGANIFDIAATTDRTRLNLAIAGDVTYRPDGLVTAPASITDISGGPEGLPEGYSASGPLLLWTQGGRIVNGTTWGEDRTQWFPPAAVNDDGSLNHDVAPHAAIPAGGTVDVLATGQSGWACGHAQAAESADAAGRLPAGDYHVYAYAWYDTGDGRVYLLSDPVATSIDE